MGRRSKKNAKALSAAKALTFNNVEDRTKPTRSPVVIRPQTFESIANYMLQLSAPHRKVFLTVKEYPVSEALPAHVRTKRTPTHLVIFCIKLMLTDHFNPLAIIQINKAYDQVEKLVIVWKALIQDLSILRLIVVGSISPATSLFHNILEILTENPHLESYIGPITYSVWPYKEIVHLYDCNSLMEQFQDALQERGEVAFINREFSANSATSDMMIYCASWRDIHDALTLSFVSCIYTTNSPTAKYISIFGSKFKKVFQRFLNNDSARSPTKDSTKRLIHLLFSFWEFANDNVDLTLNDIQAIYDKYEDFRVALATARFAYLSIETLSDDESSDDSQNSQRINIRVFRTSERLRKVCCDPSYKDNKISISDIKNRKTKGPRVEDPFDAFLQKVIYDDCDFLFKSVGKEADESAVRHDHDYLRNTHDTSSESTVWGSGEEESQIAKLLKEYFQELKEKHTLNGKKCDESKEGGQVLGESIRNQVPQETLANKNHDFTDDTECSNNILSEYLETGTVPLLPASCQQKACIDETASGLCNLDEDSNLEFSSTTSDIRSYFKPPKAAECAEGTDLEKETNLINSTHKERVESNECPTSTVSQPDPSNVSQPVNTSNPKGAISKNRAKDCEIQETDKLEEIDYKDYRRQLTMPLCDTNKPECDKINIYTARDKFNELSKRIPLESEAVRITSDWLCTFKGYLKLKEILQKRNVKKIRSNLFSLNHIDLLSTLIGKMGRNISAASCYDKEVYQFLDFQTTLELLHSGDGVYFMSQD